RSVRRQWRVRRAVKALLTVIPFASWPVRCTCGSSRRGTALHPSQRRAQTLSRSGWPVRRPQTVRCTICRRAKQSPSVQLRIHWALQTIVSSQTSANPRLKCGLDPNNFQDNGNQQAHNNKDPQMQQQRLLRRELMTETVRGMGAPLLLLGSRQTARSEAEVGDHRQKVLGKHQRHRLALRLRQHRRQATGQQMERRRRPPAARVLGATRKATRTAVPPTATPLRKPWQMLRIAVPPPLRLCVRLSCCYSRPPLPALLGKW
ncbi:uncharacterized protein Tco025E_09335, partial [Trypanosoma conorhini]